MMNKHYSQRKTTPIINEIIHASMQTMQTVKVMQTHACQHGDRMCTYPRLQRKKKPTIYDTLQRKRGGDYHNGAFSPTNLKVFVITTTWV